MSPSAAAQLSAWRWLVRGVIYGPLGGALNGVLTAWLFRQQMARGDVALDGIEDVMVVTVRGGLQIGLFYGVVFGLLARWLVGARHDPRRTTVLALAVQAPLNVVFVIGFAAMWTVVSLLVLPLVLTLAGLRLLFALDARALRAPTAR